MELHHKKPRRLSKFLVLKMADGISQNVYLFLELTSESYPKPEIIKSRGVSIFFQRLRSKIGKGIM